MGKNGMGSWLIKLLGLIPYVVSGIEQIHGDTLRGAEKKQLAMESLGLAATAAQVIDPGQQAAIQAATQLASAAIDGVKAVYNAAKAPAGPVAVPAVAPVAPVTPAPAPAAGFLQT